APASSGRRGVPVKHPLGPGRQRRRMRQERLRQPWRHEEPRMTASEQRPEPRRDLCPSGLVRKSILALVSLPLLNGLVAADDAEIGKLLKAKGVEVKESRGTVTGLTVQDGSKLTDEEFRQITRLVHLKTLSLSGGLDDG